MISFISRISLARCLFNVCLQPEDGASQQKRLGDVHEYAVSYFFLANSLYKSENNRRNNKYACRAVSCNFVPITHFALVFKALRSSSGHFLMRWARLTSWLLRR